MQRRFSSLSSRLRSSASYSSKSPGGSITFVNETNIPRLPVPDLKHTLTRYTQFLEPILNTTDEKTTFESVTKPAVDEFCRPGGEGESLHKELLALNDASETSWLDGFWSTMYLELRDPIPVNVNPFLVYSDEPAEPGLERDVQFERAAKLVHNSMHFFKALMEEALEPDRMKGIVLIVCSLDCDPDCLCFLSFEALPFAL